MTIARRQQRATGTSCHQHDWKPLGTDGSVICKNCGATILKDDPRKGG